MKFDLHTHSTASDGQLRPSEVVIEAASLGIEVMALTDHDTAKGVEEAAAEAERHGIFLIPAIELSADHSGELHILGYGIDTGSDEFLHFIEGQIARRNERNHKIIRRIQDAGYPVTEDECRINGREAGENWGRAHIARVLVGKGCFRTTGDCFAALLVPGAPTYVPRERQKAEECIRLIHSFGGKAVMAHPVQVFEDTAEISKLVSHLKENGLDGLECFYPDHTDEQVSAYLEIADALNLYVTYGSDFHGPARANHELLEGFERFAPEDRVTEFITVLKER